MICAKRNQRELSENVDLDCGVGLRLGGDRPAAAGDQILATALYRF